MTLNALWLSGLRAVAWLLVQEVFNWHHACTRLSLPLRGVVAPMDPRLESAREVCDRVLGAADDYIPPSNLGTTTDDCGCSPFCDDPPTSRGTAFARIRARVEGTGRAAPAKRARGGRESFALSQPPK